MSDRRKRNVNWTVANAEGKTLTWEEVQVAVLMDIRDELQAIRRLAECYRIPRALDAIVAMHKQGIKRRVVKRRKAKGT